MADDKDTRFRPKLGKPRALGGARAKKYLNRVLAATKRAGAVGALGAPARSRHGGRAGTARGRVAARIMNRPHPAFRQGRYRRVIVKARVVKLAGTGLSKARAHVAYIERDGAGRDGQPGRLYDAEHDQVDRQAFEARWREDRHQFRFIVSPEDGAELADLKPFVRDLMAQMEDDLGTRLEWAAVDHFNTDNPHTHIIVRGRDEQGQDLVIARDYIAHGLRRRASELLTLELGPRTDIELQNQLTGEIEQDRLTALDRRMLETAEDRVIDLRPLGSEDPEDAFVRNTMIGRALKLRRMGLATEIAPGRWQFHEDMEDTLQRAGLRGDIIKTMHAEMARQGIAHGVADYRIYEPTDPAAPTLVGRVIGKGLSDELNDRHYLIVDAVDGNTHYMDIGKDPEFGEYSSGMIVEVAPRRATPRAVDKTVAAVAARNGGLYTEQLHRQFEPQVSASFVQSHVRRLEALRRAGRVERSAAGTWTIPEDHLQRVVAYEQNQAKWRPVAVRLQSYWSLEQQVAAGGATWLDRQLTATAPLAQHHTGFGRELAEGLEARRRWLVAQQWAVEQGGQTRYTANLLAKLRRLEIETTGERLARELGKPFTVVRAGEAVMGTYRRPVDLASGRFAVVENAKAFTLVPWRAVLERARGQEVAGIMREGGSISWDVSKRRGPSVS